MENIAYKSETENEYNELLEYYDRYLKIFKDSSPKNNDNFYKNESHKENIKNGDWDDYLCDLIGNELNVNCRIKFENSSVSIQCGNK